ncbi:TetR/AcrR family transcriptional regulator [Gordonia sp. CPCC 205333]|uniref:TetR/AcrR family transcriptional regulator n=1 Tax=Gordonia sp. CPCC 205333 TaxID=3140790 RepID=UPI003AF34A88
MPQTEGTEVQPEKRVRLTAAKREAQLLDIAEETFSKFGYEGTTIDKIAKASGVSRAMVYQHHGTKDEIFLACVRRARTLFEQALIEKIGVPSTDWDAKIEAGGRVYFELIAENPQRWRLLFATSAGVGGHLADELVQLRAHTVKMTAGALRGYFPDAEGETLIALASVLSGAAEQLGRWWITDPQVSESRVLSYYVAAARGALFEMLGLPHGMK